MEGGDVRCWEGLTPDALGLIFSKLLLKEKLTVIPRICKSWRKALMEPYCWQEIDIEQWSYLPNRKPEEVLDRMLRMLIRRAGSPQKICISGIPHDAMFSFIADHAGSLETLRIPGSSITDTIVEHVAEKLGAVTFLDLSFCYDIGVPALKAFGSNCRLLSVLRRNMYCLPGLECQDDEAHAIATTMPELKHLEIASTCISTEGVLDILSGCQKLESLDVRGCKDVKHAKVDDVFLNENYPGLTMQRFYTSDDVSSEEEGDFFPWG